MRKRNKKTPKAEKQNAGNYKTRLASSKEEEPTGNNESKVDVVAVGNLGGDEFDKKFEMMLVCLYVFS